MLPYLETHMATMGIHTIPPYSQSPNLSLPLVPVDVIPHFKVARPIVIEVKQVHNLKVCEGDHRSLIEFLVLY